LSFARIGIRQAVKGRLDSPLADDGSFAIDVRVEAMDAGSPMIATLARSAASSMGPSGCGVEASSADACRTGAFEVYLVVPDALVSLSMGRVAPCTALHSKLVSRRWPNVQLVARRCKAALLPVFERWHADASLRTALRQLQAAGTAGERDARLAQLKRAIDTHSAHAGFGLLADLRCVMRDATEVVQAHHARVAAEARLRHAMVSGQPALRLSLEREQGRVSAEAWAQAEQRLSDVAAADATLERVLAEARDDAARDGGRERERCSARLSQLRQAIAATREVASPAVMAEAEALADETLELRSLASFSRAIASQRLRLVMRLRAKARAIMQHGKQSNLSTYAGEAQACHHTHAASRWHSLALLQATAETDSSAALAAKLDKHRMKARPEIVSSARLWLRVLEARERQDQEGAAAPDESMRES
jgi:hypothetical protein